MLYSQFSIDKVKQDFRLTTVEGVRFFPDSLEKITPSQRLQNILEDLPWAIAVDTEKARSEVIIPLLSLSQEYNYVRVPPARYANAKTETQSMVEPRPPAPTVKFVDEYCQLYQNLFR